MTHTVRRSRPKNNGGECVPISDGWLDQTQVTLSNVLHRVDREFDNFARS
jgi:hypothetical protein